MSSNTVGLNLSVSTAGFSSSVEQIIGCIENNKAGDTCFGFQCLYFTEHEVQNRK